MLLMARKLEGIKVFACDLTDKIYAGYPNRLQGFSTDKIDVTHQALAAVTKYLDRDKTPREIVFFEGVLKWIPNKD